MTVLIVIAIVILTICLFIGIDDIDRKKENKKKSKQLAQDQQEESIKARKLFDNSLKEFQTKYGTCTKSIYAGNSAMYSSFSTGYYKIANHILIFETVDKIIIKGVECNFSDLLEYSINDNKREIINSSQSVTTTSTGSMVGRAIVGGVLLGGVGALAGATTAKKTTTTAAPNTETKHNYKIHITVNSISNPILTLNLGADESKARKIASLLSVIIERNKK